MSSASATPVAQPEVLIHPHLTENGVILANKYGDVAVMVAVQTASDEWRPKERWESATATLFPNSPASQRRNTQLRPTFIENKS